MSPNLVVHLGKQLKDVVSFNFTVTIIEDASGVMVDEFSGLYTSSILSKLASLQKKNALIPHNTPRFYRN